MRNMRNYTVYYIDCCTYSYSYILPLILHNIYILSYHVIWSYSFFGYCVIQRVFSLTHWLNQGAAMKGTNLRQKKTSHPKSSETNWMNQQERIDSCKLRDETRWKRDKTKSFTANWWNWRLWKDFDAASWLIHTSPSRQHFGSGQCMPSSLANVERGMFGLLQLVSPLNP